MSFKSFETVSSYYIPYFYNSTTKQVLTIDNGNLSKIGDIRTVCTLKVNAPSSGLISNICDLRTDDLGFQNTIKHIDSLYPTTMTEVVSNVGKTIAVATIAKEIGKSNDSISSISTTG